MSEAEQTGREFINRAEMMSAEERIDQKVEDGVREWIRTDYADRMRRSLETKPDHRGKHWYLDNVRMGADLTRAIWVLGDGRDTSDLVVLDPLLRSDLLDPKNKESVVSQVGPKLAKDAESSIIGSVSVLTCLDAIGGARPDLKKSLELTSVLAPVEADASYGTDLILRFGDTNPYYQNAEIVRLVQLKTGSNGELKAYQLDRGRPTFDPSGKMSRETVGRMHQYAELLEKRQEEEGGNLIDVQAYVLTVPAMTHSNVMNTFGIITSVGQGARENILGTFAREARKAGLLPQEERRPR